MAGSGGAVVCCILPQPAGIAVTATALTGSGVSACVPLTPLVTALAGGAAAPSARSMSASASAATAATPPPPPTFLSVRSVVLWDRGRAAASGSGDSGDQPPFVWQATASDTVVGVAVSQDAGMLAIATRSATSLVDLAALGEPAAVLPTRVNPGGCIALSAGPLCAYAPDSAADDDVARRTLVVDRVGSTAATGSCSRVASILCDTPPQLWRLSRCGRLLAVATDGGSSVDLYAVGRASHVATFRRGVLGSALHAMAFFHVQPPRPAAPAAGDAAAAAAAGDGLPPPSWLAVAGASPTIHVFAIPGGPPVTPGGAMHPAMYDEELIGEDEVDGSGGGGGGGSRSSATALSAAAGASSGVAAALAAAAGGATRLARRLGGQRAFTIARIPAPHADAGVSAVAITATPAPVERSWRRGGSLASAAAPAAAAPDTDDFADVVSTSLLGAAATRPPSPPPAPAPPAAAAATTTTTAAGDAPATTTMDFVLTAVTTSGVILQYLIDASGSSPECVLLAVHNVLPPAIGAASSGH